MQNVINSEAVPGMNFHSLASSCAMMRSESIKATFDGARKRFKYYYKNINEKDLLRIQCKYARKLCSDIFRI